jgi:hypothetical protein
VFGRFRPFVWPLVVASLAAVIYTARVRREMVDFGVYRLAASRALSTQPLYRPDDGHYQFKYLPTFALAMAPFALVEEDTAKAMWFAFSIGLLIAFVRWSVRALPERRRPERVVMWLTVLLMAKFYAHEVTLGQTNILLGALLVAALLAAQVDLPRVAGGLIAAAAFVKPYALLLLPWLAVSHGASAALAGVLVLGAGLLLPAAAYGWQGNLDLLAAWYRTVTESTTSNLLVSDNVSLAAMWAKWLGPGSTATVLATLSSGAVLGLSAVVWLKRRPVAVPDYLEVALLMLIVPLVSPQGWDYVLLLATPAAMCLVDRWKELGGAWRGVAGAALVLMGLTFFDIMGRTMYTRFMALSIVSVAALAVAAALARLRWRALA